VPVAEITLQIDQQASFTAGPMAWIGGGQGVNLAGTTPTVTLRQQPSDTPIITLTSTPSANGVVTYLAPVPNFPYLPPSADNESNNPTLITLYPFQVQFTAVGIALLEPVLYCRWKLNIQWPDSTSIDLIHGPVMIAWV